MSNLKGIRVPHNATLDEAARVCADHFLLFLPSSWDNLHAKAKAAGFMLLPARCQRSGCQACRPGSEALQRAPSRVLD
jgi:hypothetical protein